jgi:hypothetical protein
MKFNLMTQLLLASVTVAGTVAMTTQAQAIPKVGASGTSSSDSRPTIVSQTSFVCVPETNGNYATVARKGSRQAPLIVWTAEGSSYFGDKYPPQTRCNLVTQKLNGVVGSSGGSLKQVALINGIVSGETVICAIAQNDTGCTSNNMLFTLKPENSNRAGEILKKISKFAKEGSGAGYIEETSWGDISVNLGEWENQALGATDDPIVPQENPQEENNPIFPQEDSGF